MTFDEYIKNPMGTKSSVMSNRQMYRDMYTEKWGAITVRENGIINYKLYKAGDDYYIHFKIPSEIVPKFYYDTVIRLYSRDRKLTGTIKSLSAHDVQFFSNDPNFIYTFAHAFKKAGLLISDLEFKINPINIKTKAIEKNPKDEIGYVKSLYFAYLAMKSLNLFSKSQWEAVSTPYTKSVWKSTVEHADDKIRDRQDKGNEIRKKEHKNAIKEKRKTTNTQMVRKACSVHFGSPNIKDFGKFKRENFNTISKSKIGQIKKNINN